MADSNNVPINRKEFQRRVWITVGIVALVVVVVWILKAVISVLLLILAGALIALYFRGFSGLICRKTGLSEKISLPLAIIGSLLLLAGFIWLTGTRLQQQTAQLSQSMPATIQEVKDRLNQSPLGQQVLQQVSSKRSMEKTRAVVQRFFSTTFGALGDIYVVLFLGLFFTAGPGVYVKGILKLIPPAARPRADKVVTHIGSSLTKWLKGKLFAMLVVAVLTLIGLLFLGMPMAFVLALIAGLLNFIPNFGPLIAMIPAVGIGLLQSPTTALLVAGLYILVQVLESNVITPQIQKRLVEIPPALIIIAQLLMGVLTGGWGLILATPVVLIVIVLVQDLWIKRQEG